MVAGPGEPPAPSESAPSAAAEARSEPRLEAAELPRLEGRLRRTRTGPVRALLIVTGLALLAWLGRALLALVGYRHEVQVSLRGSGLELVGRRKLLGLGLGETRELVPAAALRRVGLVGDSALWAVLAALAVLLCAGAAATVLLLWGIVGRQPSWIALAAAVVGAGLLLDGAAYLWLRRSRARGRATLELDAVGRRYRVTRVAERSAHRLLDALQERPRG